MEQKTDVGKKESQRTSARIMLKNFTEKFYAKVAMRFSETEHGIDRDTEKTKNLNEKMKNFGKTTDSADSDRININYKTILKAVIMAVISLIFSRVEFAMGIYPFGIALMCAMSKNIIACWAGAILGAATGLGSKAWIYVLVYSLVAVSRYALGKWLGSGGGIKGDEKIKSKRNKKMRAAKAAGAKVSYKAKISASDIHIKPKKKLDEDDARVNRNLIYKENVYIRMAIACTASCVVSAYNVIAGGYLYYDLFAAVFAAVICPIITFVYCGVTEKYARHTPYCEAGWSAMMFTAVFAVRDIPLFGLNMGILASFAAALYVSWSGGIMRGGIAGLICGIACEPLYAPLYGIAGMAAGIFWNISAFIAVAAACVLGLCWGVYTGGFSALSKILPEMVGVSVIISPLIKFQVLQKLTIFSRTSSIRGVKGESPEITELRQKSTSVKLKALSDTFESLSGVFYNLSDRLRRPGILELRQLCETACDKYCTRCGMQSVCWDREYGKTMDTWGRMTTSLHSMGRVSAEIIPAYMAERCYNMDKIIDEVNLSYAKILEQSIRCDKTEVFAIDYEAMAKLLSDASRTTEDELRPDPELSRKLRRSLQYLDFYAADISVYGGRSKLVKASGLDLSRVRMGAEDIRRAVENICGTRMCAPEFAIDGEDISMTIKTARMLGAEYAKCTVAQKSDSEKRNSGINGDVINIFEGAGDKFYSLISDGMGSGREAALTSQVCALFLERMLTSGASVALSLQMLNNFIRTKGMECSATIDLMELDMITGEACFIKSGAAPSFVKRGGNLFKLQSKTVPIGIMRALDAEQIKFNLEEGDKIIMLSDGIAQSFDECTWLLDMLSGSDFDRSGIETIAEKIMEAAEERNKRTDDMTVGVISICREHNTKIL